MGRIFKRATLPTGRNANYSVWQCLLVGFSLLTMIVYSKGFIYSLFTDLTEGLELSQDVRTNGSVAAQHPEIWLIYVTLYMVTAMLLLKHWKEGIQLLIRQKYVVGMLALVFVSSIWSVVPGFTFSRGVALTGSTLFGVLLALEFTPRQQLHLLTLTGIILILSSLVWVVALPELGIAKGSHEGLWQGIFAHKNLLGKVMVLVSLPLLLSSMTNRRSNGLYLFFFWLSVGLLVLSSSRTAQFSAMGLYLTLSIYLITKHGIRAGMVTGIVVILLLGNMVIQHKYDFVAAIALEKLTFSLLCSRDAATPDVRERDMELKCRNWIDSKPESTSEDRLMDGNGRFELWKLVVHSIKKDPILGYGYGGFWLGEDGPSASIKEKIGIWPRDAHNGTLGILLDLGLLGLSLFVLTLVQITWRTFPMLLKSESNPLDLFYPGLIVLIFLCSMGETDFIAPNFLFWILIVMSALSITRRQDMEQECSIQGT
jgi:exopolysaccharide production protein ExoQ